jgi:hypothetical protein
MLKGIAGKQAGKIRSLLIGLRIRETIGSCENTSKHWASIKGGGGYCVDGRQLASQERLRFIDLKLKHPCLLGYDNAAR